MRCEPLLANHPTWEQPHQARVAASDPKARASPAERDPGVRLATRWVQLARQTGVRVAGLNPGGVRRDRSTARAASTAVARAPARPRSARPAKPRRARPFGPFARARSR